MLILTRKVGESIVIANDIIVKVIETGKNSVRIGIDAPREISILRQEVFDAIQKENILSSQKTDNIDITTAAKLIGNKGLGKKIMKIDTRQFGEMSIDDEKIINMPDGIPGFRQQKRYVLLEKKETSPFYLFQCVDDPNLAFVVMDPLRFYPEYTLSVKDFDNTIKWEFGKEELSCFVIITIPQGKPEDMTANFMAPIVINNERKEGMQLILQGSPYSHQQLLLK